MERQAMMSVHQKRTKRTSAPGTKLSGWSHGERDTASVPLKTGTQKSGTLETGVCSHEDRRIKSVPLETETLSQYPRARVFRWEYSRYSMSNYIKHSQLLSYYSDYVEAMFNGISILLGSICVEGVSVRTSPLQTSSAAGLPDGVS